MNAAPIEKPRPVAPYGNASSLSSKLNLCPAGGSESLLTGNARRVQTVSPVSRRGDYVANKTPPSESLIMRLCPSPNWTEPMAATPTIGLPGSRPVEYQSPVVA
jgi:hypothetical protein